MDFNRDDLQVGEQVGIEGYHQLVEQAQAVCECERQRIEIANRPLISVKKAEYALELEKEEELRARVYQARPPHEHQARRRRVIYSSIVVAVLVVAGFVLSLLTLEPFQLGLKGIFYSLGIAICVPYLVETTLDRLASERFVRVLVTVSSIVALVSLMTLAVVRGQLLAKRTQEDSASVVIEGEDPQPAQTKNSFYDDTVPLLQIVMVLLAFAMEVGAGIAMHEAERVSANLGESYDELQRARQAVQKRLSELAHEILSLESEGALFVSKFWRDFHWAVFKRSVGGISKAFMVGALIVLAVLTPTAKAQQPIELVVLIDLSQSVATTGPDSRSQFQKNVAGVSQVLRQVPAGTHVAVVGITDDSFGATLRSLVRNRWYRLRIFRGEAYGGTAAPRPLMEEPEPRLEPVVHRDRHIRSLDGGRSDISKRRRGKARYSRDLFRHVAGNPGIQFRTRTEPLRCGVDRTTENAGIRTQSQ